MVGHIYRQKNQTSPHAEVGFEHRVKIVYWRII